MKFSASALVLATLAVESASAASLRHAHRHLHEKKSAQKVEQEKRDAWTPPPGYDWHTDPGNIWKPSATAAPAAAASTPAAGAQLKQANAVVSSVSTKASASASSNDDSKSDSSSASDDLADAVGNVKNLLGSVSKYVNGAIKVAGKTILAGDNPTTENDFIWIGDGGAYTNTLINESDDEVNVVFWKNEPGAGQGNSQYLDSHAPAVSVRIPAGSSVPVSMAQGASGAYTAIYPDTQWSDISYLLQTTLGEFTAAGQSTTFDVSRLWYMKGHGLTIDTGDCKSSTVDNACAYYCKDSSSETCGDANTYGLNVVGDKCKLGYKDYGSGPQPEGGCPVSGTKITTTFHN